MKYRVEVSQSDKANVQAIWEICSQAEIIEVTPFGDFFVKDNNNYYLYSLTDHRYEDVTDLIEKHGLPPVSFELGDEWYQLDAQVALNEDGQSLSKGECFGFNKPLADGGDYSLGNISVKNWIDYNAAAKQKGLEIIPSDSSNSK